MPQVTVNYLAVLAVGVEAMVIGMLWYGPLFGKTWLKLIGANPNDHKEMAKMKKESGPAMASSIVGSLLTGYVLSHVVDYAGSKTLTDGLLAGFWMWLGFVTPVVASGVLYGRKPFKLFYVDSGYYLAHLLVAGVIVTLWV